MCSRICERPAPRRSSSQMLPVAHHACTLATGALWSSCTITVRPSSNTHFFAELGGKLITAESSLDAAFKLATLNIITDKIAALGDTPVMNISTQGNSAEF